MDPELHAGPALRQADFLHLQMQTLRVPRLLIKKRKMSEATGVFCLPPNFVGIALKLCCSVEAVVPDPGLPRPGCPS